MVARNRLAGIALAASLIGSALAGPTALAGIPTFSATCVVGGNSTFTNPGGSAAAFAWAWRTGTKVLRSGTGMVAAGATKTLTTPARATTDTKFGVVRISDGVYDYPTCASSIG